MCSEKKLLANRRNALKSTGPRTPEGKARSCLNAVTHGLRAETVILNVKGHHESQAEFDTLLAALTEEIQPRGTLEIAEVENMAVLYWRHLRCLRAESLAFLAPETLAFGDPEPPTFLAPETCPTEPNSWPTIHGGEEVGQAACGLTETATRTPEFCPNEPTRRVEPPIRHPERSRRVTENCPNKPNPTYRHQEPPVRHPERSRRVAENCPTEPTRHAERSRSMTENCPNEPNSTHPCAANVYLHRETAQSNPTPNEPRAPETRHREERSDEAISLHGEFAPTNPRPQLYPTQRFGSAVEYRAPRSLAAVFTIHRLESAVDHELKRCVGRLTRLLNARHTPA